MKLWKLMFKRHNLGAHSQVSKIGLLEARVSPRKPLSFPLKLGISTVSIGEAC